MKEALPMRIKEKTMSKLLTTITPIMLLLASNTLLAEEDPRQLVELPEMMQQHLMTNMRDHLVVINEILIHLASEEMDEAADLTESRLGMSSLKSHEASHMAKFMPKGMQQAGTSMHRAASRFALKAQEGDLLPAYQALTEITSACVACHTSYRIR